MNGLSILVRAAETTAEAVTEAAETAVYPTSFSDLKIPTISMVMMGVAAAVILAAMIAGVYYLYKHTDSWGIGLLVGLAAYMLFCHFLMLGLQLALSAIPFTKNFITEHPTEISVFMALLSGLLTCLGIFLAMKYAESQQAKRGLSLTIGIPLALGVGMYIGCVLMNRLVFLNASYVMVSLSINKAGFDGTAAPYIENLLAQGDITVEEATKEIENSLSFLGTTPFIIFLLDALYYVMMAVLEAAAAVLIFGERMDRIERKWVFVGYGGLMLTTVPGILSSTTGLPNWVGTLFVMIVAAVVAVVAYKQVEENMPEELESLTQDHRRNRRNKKDDDKPKKMPHIVMPDK